MFSVPFFPDLFKMNNDVKQGENFMKDEEIEKRKLEILILRIKYPDIEIPKRTQKWRKIMQRQGNF